MRIALLSDIHGNLEALSAVLNDIRNHAIDKIYCLGDVIGYGYDPNACLDLISKCCEVKLMGNHEYAALGLLSTEYYNQHAKKSAEWTAMQLTDYEISLMADFKLVHVTDDFRFVHSSPFEPDCWHYIVSPNQAAQAFKHFDEKICFFGHSHVPMIFAESATGIPRSQTGHDFQPDPEGRYLINAGSVGQPRDDDPRACYLVFDTDEYEVLYQRVEYDVATAQDKMRQLKLPEMLIERLAIGK